MIVAAGIGMSSESVNVFTEPSYFLPACGGGGPEGRRGLLRSVAPPSPATPTLSPRECAHTLIAPFGAERGKKRYTFIVGATGRA